LKAPRDHISGFTLVEMSVVLVIIGTVIMIVYPALSAIRQSQQQQLTSTNLAALMRATAAFVQANGCLPCPTPASTLGTGFGRVRGDAVNALCGTCNVPEGVPPFVSLGVPLSTAKDGWGHWITMRVDPALTINFDVVPPTSLCLPGDPLPCVQGESRKGLCQPSLPATNRINVLTPAGATQQAAILFLSHGANGYGAFYADATTNTGSDLHPVFRGAAAACTSTGGFERCNANNDRDFVNASFSNDPTTAFDDQLAFLARNTLITALGNPACQTEW